MRKKTAWSVGELAISIEEKKIAKGIRVSNQVFATHDTECIPEIRGPLGPEFEGGSRRRVAECQNRGMERLPWCTSLELFGLAAEWARG